MQHIPHGERSMCSAIFIFFILLVDCDFRIIYGILNMQVCSKKKLLVMFGKNSSLNSKAKHLHWYFLCEITKKNKKYCQDFYASDPCIAQHLHFFITETHLLDGCLSPHFCIYKILGIQIQFRPLVASCNSSSPSHFFLSCSY